MAEKKAEEAKKPSLEKLKALQLAMDKIEKDHGKGTIMKMGDNKVEDVAVISTGSIGLNVALGVGGYPRGRVIEIYGPESSGKTTLAIHAIAEAQKAGGIAAIIDAEHAFDRFYAEKLGVNIDELLISQPDNGEQALEIADQFIRSSAIDIIVIDSVAAIRKGAYKHALCRKHCVNLQPTSIAPTQHVSLSISCATKLALCLAVPKQQPVVMHLSFMLRCASISAALVS